MTKGKYVRAMFTPLINPSFISLNWDLSGVCLFVCFVCLFVFLFSFLIQNIHCLSFFAEAVVHVTCTHNQCFEHEKKKNYGQFGSWLIRP